MTTKERPISRTVANIPADWLKAFKRDAYKGKIELTFSAYMREALKEKLEKDGAL